MYLKSVLQKGEKHTNYAFTNISASVYLLKSMLS